MIKSSQLSTPLTTQDISFLNRVLSAIGYLIPGISASFGRAAPPAEFLRDGMLAYSDGSWGAGEGLNRYDLGTTSWVLVGSGGGGDNSIDGGFANAVFLPSELIDGGGAV